VSEPFTADAHLDINKLEELTIIGVRLLDNTLDDSKYPLKKQLIESQKKRRIGLGITGLADALMMCNLRYGSNESIESIKKNRKCYSKSIN
jgi:ribonucleoside-diphosphate reductase alpha chain